MGVTVDKQGKINLSLGVVASAVVAMITAYPVARAALAGELQELVKKEVKPLSDAFVITLETNVRNYRDSLSAMTFKRDMCAGVPGCWTLGDQQAFDRTLNDLKAAEDALKSLRSPQ